MYSVGLFWCSRSENDGNFFTVFVRGGGFEMILDGLD
jgi:hypothetical protein